MRNVHNRLIIDKASQLGMECGLLIPGCEDFLELTYKGKTIIINKTRSHRMTLMAGLLAKDKQASNLLLRRSGLPVPDDIVVSELSGEAFSFLHTHRQVTVKPLDSSRSAGVTVGVSSETELTQAFRTAGEHSDRVMIQRNVEGLDYRVLVIAGQAIGALEYQPAYLTGDGRSTVEQLIRRLNEEQRRRNPITDFDSFKPVRTESDELLACLKQQGKALEDVLDRGEQVQLFATANALAGEISEVVTDKTAHIHPLSLQMAVEAAAALQIDVAGIDIRCRNISEPLGGDNGGILEVNALPDMIDPHLYLQNASADAIAAYLHYLFED
ncbi:ATP-grasp domain-containing protein [Paenibacillus kobensis]|uniref:hypothetical protein n=1 Tax=Paenibacillus kobensis TaxID=59841 RepID=UPI001FE7A7FA|nr:hypothetical protein [Paenibacillus kobensis]